MDLVALGEKHSRNQSVLRLFGNHMTWYMNVKQELNNTVHSY